MFFCVMLSCSPAVDLSLKKKKEKNPNTAPIYMSLSTVTDTQALKHCADARHAAGKSTRSFPSENMIQQASDVRSNRHLAASLVTSRKSPDLWPSESVKQTHSETVSFHSLLLIARAQKV